MPFFNVTIEGTGEVFRCKSDESLLSGMARLGKRGIPVGCRGGGCGVCKIHIQHGCYDSSAMSRAFVSQEEQADGTVLACRVRPCSDIALHVIGAMKKNVGA